MPDPIVTPAAPAPVPSPEAAPLTLESLATVLAERDARLFARLKPPAAPAPVAPVATPTPPAQSDKERLDYLENQARKDAAERESNIRNGAIETALKAAEKEFSEPQRVALRSVFESQAARNITIEDGKAVYNSPETGRITVEAAFSSFLKGPIATALKPAPSLPGGAALAPGQAAPAAPASEWEGKTFKEVLAIRDKNPGKFAELITKPENRTAYLKILASI